jgi:hypothetical protein
MGRGFYLGGDVLFIHPGIVGAGVLLKRLAGSRLRRI